MDTHENPTSNYLPRLLLVDDDPAMIRLIAEMLAEFPDQRFATTGEAAIALAREATPDLILLDANLPNMTGFDVCEILKRDVKLARVPVIFVTSHDAPALEVDAFRMGAADYVIKPLIAPRLQARVRAQLRSHGRLMELAARLREGATPEPPPQASTRVLAILDAEAADLHHDALEAIGALEVVRDCAAALEAARERAPGAVVLDSRCCAADSADQALRGLLEAHAEAPVVVLVDDCDIATEQRLLDAGAADVIALPVRPAVLQARLRAALATALRFEEDVRGMLESSANRGQVHVLPLASFASSSPSR
jgi:two-component system, cell cycle response regulator